MSRFNTKQFYFSLLAVIAIGFVIDIFLFVTSSSSATVVTAISENKDLASAYIPSTGLQLKDLPAVHDLPVNISWSQTLKMREYLNRQTTTESNKDAYFRNSSLSTTSDGTSFLIDAPIIKRTYMVELLSDGNISMGCGGTSDQKDASWVCKDTSEVSE